MNPDDLRSTLCSSATVLNRVNCSGAPDCASLNRMGCWSTEGTCGNCAVGYLGLMGSSNTPCLQGNHQTLLSSSLHSDGKTSVAECNSDADCADEFFQECNFQSNLCQSIQQTCPNSCSGHGRCVFASKYDLNETLDECRLLDGGCAPRCECETDFMGSSCSLGVNEFLMQVDLRHLILENVKDLMKMDNVEVGNVKSWMKTLSSVIPTDYLGLSENSKILMSSMVIDILNTSAAIGLPIEDLRETGMDEVVDMCVSGLSSIEWDVDSRILLMTLLQQYSAFVTSDMSEDQFPSWSLSPFLRSSSFFLTSPALLSLPQTDIESLENISQHSVYLPADIVLPLKITISETLIISSSSLLSSANISRKLNSLDGNGTRKQMSLPLFISLGSSSSCSSEDCVMKLILKHKQSPKYSTFVNTTNDSHYFEADCHVGEVMDYEFLCPSGDKLVIFCNGSFSGRGRRYCPRRSLMTICETHGQFYSSSAEPRDISCLYSPIESTESTTTCLCNISNLDDSSGSVSFTVLSIGKSVVTEFASTWETAPAMSAGQVASSWVVLVTVGGVGFLFVLGLFLSIQTDKHESQLVSTMDIEAKQKHRIDSDSESKLGPNPERKLIEETLPTIFNSDSLWLKFKEEMRVYHRWLGIVFYYSPEFPRSMRVLSLFSSIVIMLFVQSVTYNIADPDDGSCEKCQDEISCLSLKSTLNSREERCFWKISSAVNTTSGEGSCHFRDIGEDMTRMFIVAIISAVVSAPLALSIQYLIMNVLSKHCVSGEEATKEKQRHQLRDTEHWNSWDNRRIAGMTSSTKELVEKCGRTLLEDLNNLLKELFMHYTSLLELGQVAEDQAKAFRNAWGSLVVERPTSKLIKVSVWFPRHHKSSSQHEETMADVLKELGKIRRCVFQEYQRLEALETRNVESQKEIMILTMKKRLLFLFVKDLSSRVSGGVLSSKSERDSQMSRGLSKIDRVQWQLKWIAGLFVGVLDSGMLLYVYFFAMNQTHSRQKAWFISFVMWLGFEIFLSSTVLVLVLHLLIPLYVWSDVSEVKKKVLADLMKFRERYLTTENTKNDIETGSGTKENFNAAKFFFPSWRLASLFPDIPESQLVLQFSTPWPRKKFGKEEGKVAKEYEDDVLLTAASNVLLYFLTSLLHYNFLVQDILIQTLCNGGLGSLLVLLLHLWNIYPWLLVLGVLALLLCIYFLGRFSLNNLVKKFEEKLTTPAIATGGSGAVSPASGVAALDLRNPNHEPKLSPLQSNIRQEPNPLLESDFLVRVHVPEAVSNTREENHGDNFTLGGRCIWESDESSSDESASKCEESQILDVSSSDESSSSSSDASIEVIVVIRDKKKTAQIKDTELN